MKIKNMGIVKYSLLQVFIKNKLLTGGLILTIILGSILQLIPPQLLKRIIDQHISTGIIPGMWKLATLYLMVSIISGLTDLLREVCTSYLGQRALSKIRLSMVQRMSKFSIQYFNDKPTGEIMSHIISDVDSVGTLFSRGIVSMAADLFKAIGILISLFIFSPWIGLYGLLILPIVYLISRLFRKKAYITQMEVRKTVGKINSFLQEIFTGIFVIKSYGKEDVISTQFQPILCDNVEAVRKTNFLDSIFPVITQIVRALAISLIIILIAPAGIIKIGLSAGALVAAVDLISRMFAPVEAIATEYQTIQEAFAGLRRIQEFEREPVEDREYIQGNIETDFTSGIAVSLSNVVFGYNNGNNVLKGVSFDVPVGSKIAIIGRTGVGKSTLINLIAGLYMPLCGKILIAGLDPYTINPLMRRSIIGIVNQRDFTIDGTVMDLITLGDERISLHEVIEATSLVGIHDDIMQLKDTYQTKVGEGDIYFSNGQLQLLALARAVVCNPPILLLDEVSSGLDAVTEAKVFSALRGISEGRTIITISHRVSGILDADIIHIIDGGRIVESGSPSQLVNREGWYSIYNRLEKLGWER